MSNGHENCIVLRGELFDLGERPNCLWTVIIEERYLISTCFSCFSHDFAMAASTDY